MSNENSRLEHIDFLKGFAIFLVVMGHFLAWTFPVDIKPGKYALFVKEIIYSFHMPLFFFISGYLVDLKGHKWTNHFCLNLIRKRLVSLMLPGFSFLLIYYLWADKWIFPWFLMVLFEVYLIFVFVKFLTSTKVSNKIEFIFLFLFVVVLFGVGRLFSETEIGKLTNFSKLPRYYLFFVLGYLFFKLNINYWLLKKEWIFTTSLFVWGGLFFYNFECDGVINNVLSVIMALSAILVCWNFAQDIDYDVKKKFVSLFINWGKASLAIYLLSPLLTPVFPELGVYIIVSNDYVRSGNVSEAKHMTSFFLQMFSGGGISIIVCEMALCMKRCLRKSNFLNLFLFGENHYQKKRSQIIPAKEEISYKKGNG